MALTALIPDPNAPALNTLPPMGGPPQFAPPLMPDITNPRSADEQRAQKLADTPTGLSSLATPAHGFWQHVRKIAEGIGNVAGDIVAPGTMALIPGTQLHREIQARQGASALAGLQGQDVAEAKAASDEAEQGAQAGNLATESSLAPAKAASLGAQTREANDRASALENPQPDLPTAYAHRVNEVLASGGDPAKDAMAQGLLSAMEATKPAPKTPPLEHVSGMVNGKPLEGVFHPDTGKFTNPETGQELIGFQPIPPQPSGSSIVLNPSTRGGYVAQEVRPGSHIAPGAVTVSGMNSLDTPTAQTRNMAEMAKTVLPQMTAISNEVDQMAQQIGPAAGRWNQLMVNKGGKDFPQFAKLDTDLDLLASAIVRTHFGARGGQQYREELRKQFGEAQSPEDLKARIAGANSWLQGYAHMADPSGHGGQSTVAPPAGAKIIKWGDVK